MSISENNNSKPLVFLQLKGEGLPADLTKGNTAMVGHEGQIRLVVGKLIRADAGVERDGFYPDGLQASHRFLVRGYDVVDDMYNGNASILLGLINAEDSGLLIESAKIHYAKIIGKKLVTVRTDELDNVKISAVENDESESNILTYQCIISGPTGRITINPYSKTGELDAAKTTELRDLSTLNVK